MILNINNKIIVKYLRSFLIEITYSFFLLGFYLIELANTNMLLQKSCRYNTTSEPDLSTPCDDEKKGMEFVTFINSTYRFGMNLLSIIIIIFVSAWSDKISNRHRIILFILVGQVLQAFLLTIQSYFWYLSPMIIAWTEIVSQTIFLGNIGIHIFATILICDLAEAETRTMRLTILLAIDLFCKPCSSGISGYVMHYFGFFITYLICLSLAICGLICALFIKNMSKMSESTEVVNKWQLFHLKPILDSFRTVYEKKEGKPRIIISILFIISLLVYFTWFGEASVFYLYLRYRFKWNEEKFGIYLFYKLTGSVIGMILSSLILAKLLKLHDGLIGAFAGFWDTAAAFGYLLAKEEWQLYLVPLLDIFHGVALAVCESLLTKFFSNDELGRLFSVYLIICAFVTLSGLTYNIIFEKTMDTFPAAIFLLSIPIDATICLLYAVCYFSLKMRNVKPAEKHSSE